MKKIQHHYISETYLKNFCDENNHVWVIGENDKIFFTNPNNIFKENHFNTVNGSLAIEENLSEIEGKFNSIIQDKIKKHILISVEEKALLSLYLSTIFNRVKIRRESEKKALEDLVTWADSFKGTISSAIPSTGKTINIEAIRKSLEDFKPFFAGSSYDVSFYVADYIFKMNWRFLLINNEGEFITSDNPAQLCRPEAENKYGLNAFGSRAGFAHIDSEFTVPLTPKIMVLAGWINNSDLDYIDIPVDWLNSLNYRTYRCADWVVSNKKEKLEELLKKAKNTSS